MAASGQAGTGRSLAEVYSSVGTGQMSFWRRVFAFAGPAYLVSVGYMDPGNWATDIEGGARFGYRLLWVLVMSNAMAILLQTLSARLGIVSGRDLAQACRETYPRRVNITLWVLCEIAIGACDLAEVLGAAIGLNLLFHVPLLAGVILTAADTLLLLWFQSFGIRTIEAFVLSLIAVMAGCFCVEIFWAHPSLPEMLTGLEPRLDRTTLYLAVTILGATVMPHNMYLHSALVQTRSIGHTVAEKRVAARFNLLDSVVALNGALLVNAAILVLAAAVFFKRGIVVTEIQQAHVLLVPLLGTSMAGVIFAVALLCSGQSSTLTGTLAGQVVMEGFLNFRMQPWLRRLITRTLAVIPAAITIYVAGDKSTLGLLLLSQAIISMQLPFAIVPLIQFTNDPARMGEFANRAWVRVLSWVTAAVIIVLNGMLAAQAIADGLSNAGPWRLLVWVVGVPTAVFLLGLLGWMMLHPQTVARRAAADAYRAAWSSQPAPAAMAPYQRILVPLDHSPLDRLAVSHAASMAKLYDATVFLLHVEEDVTSRIYGPESSTAEVAAGEQYLNDIAESLRSQGLTVETAISHAASPRREIIRYARQVQPDLVVMGAHGHWGLKDLIFGTTINPVRHDLEIPILIVRPGKK